MKIDPNWRKNWKFYSKWGYAFLLILPELYAALTPILGLETIPTFAQRVVQLIAAVSLIASFIKQTKPDGTVSFLPPP